MTTIVARQLKGDVEFASDSLATLGDRGTVRDCSKVFRSGNLAIAVGGSVRVESVLRFADLPYYEEDIEAHEFVVNCLVPAMREAIAEAGVMGSDEDGIEDCRSMFIVAVDGEAFGVGSDFGVIRESSGVYALGTGSDYALGAVAAGASLEDAVQIAATFDIHTGGRIDVARFSELVQ